MDETQASEQLAVIRRIMESATQITVLPGWAAILGGVLALIGCAATLALMESLNFGVLGGAEPTLRAGIIGIWVAIGGLGVGIDLMMSARLARKRGMQPWSRLSHLAAYAMGPPIAVALVISVALALRDAWALIPGVWMLHYGVAVWTTGILSLRAPGGLGLTFMLAGAIALLWATPISLILVALTFGLAHIIFGVYLLVRFGD